MELPVAVALSSPAATAALAAPAITRRGRLREPRAAPVAPVVMAEITAMVVPAARAATGRLAATADLAAMADSAGRSLVTAAMAVKAEQAVPALTEQPVPTALML